jgi:hypothetical protein
LAAGEIGFETDSGQFKMGDGINQWSELSYFKNLEDLGGNLDDYIPITLIDQPDGIPYLNADKHIPKRFLATVVDGAAAAYDTLNKIGVILAAAPTTQYVTDAVAGANSYTDNAVGDAVTDLTTLTQTAQSNAETTASGYVSTHAADTTNVHGITDTANLVYTSALTSGLAGKQDVVSGVSATEIGYLDGVTSAIQTQIDGKAASSHTHAISGVTDLQTTLDGKLNLSGGTLTGALTLSGAPTSDLHPATKLYVDNVAAGINFHEAVHAASINNLAANYSNGTSGVGATLTADTNRAFSTLDGESVVVGQRVLIKNQTDAKQNGIYTLTTNGSGSAPWVLTRATDADNNPTGEMKAGDFVFVTNGTTNASFGFVNNSTATPIVIGTDNITYTQFNAAKTVVAGTNLDEATPGTLSVVNAPTFSGLVTASSGVAFSDGTQVKVGVPSLTEINQKTSAYTTVLADRDKLVEVSSASGVTVTIPTNASVAYPVGTSIDILQTGAGQVTIAGAGGVTVNATPGLKLRTQWSSATLFKRATDTWVVFGDLSA